MSTVEFVDDGADAPGRGPDGPLPDGRHPAGAPGAGGGSARWAEVRRDPLARRDVRTLVWLLAAALAVWSPFLPLFAVSFLDVSGVDRVSERVDGWGRDPSHLFSQLGVGIRFGIPLSVLAAAALALVVLAWRRPAAALVRVVLAVAVPAALAATAVPMWLTAAKFEQEIAAVHARTPAADTVQLTIGSGVWLATAAAVAAVLAAWGEVRAAWPSPAAASSAAPSAGRSAAPDAPSASPAAGTEWSGADTARL